MAAVYPWERPNHSFLHLQEDESGQLQDEHEAEAEANDGAGSAACLLPFALRPILRF